MPERKKNKYFHFKDSSVNILFCFVSVPNGTVRYGTVRYGTVRYGAVRYGTVRYGTVRYGTWPMCCQFICFGNFTNGYNFLCVTMINSEIHSAGIVRCYIRNSRHCEMYRSISTDTTKSPCYHHYSAACVDGINNIYSSCL